MNTEKQRQFLIRFCYLALILVIAVFICRYAISALLPFVIAFLVSLLLRPLVRFLNEKCCIQKSIAAVVTVLLFYVVVGTALVLLSIRLFATGKAFVMGLPETYNTVIEPLLSRLADEVQGFVARLDPGALGTFNGIVSGIGSSIEATVLSFSGKALSAIGGYAISIPGFLLNTLISIIATVFITMDFPLLKRFVVNQLSEAQHQRLHEVKVHLGKTLGRYVRSYALILLITFCELSAGLLIIGIDAAVPIAMMIALFDILPVVGSGTVLIPWAIITGILGNYRLAISLVALYIVIVIVRNIIEPKIVGQHVGLHPIVTLLSMVVGTYVFGPVGLLGLPVALAIAVSMNDAGVIHLYNKIEPEPRREPQKRPLRTKKPPKPENPAG